MRGDALNQVFAAAGRPRVGGEIADCPFQIGPGVQRDPENDFGPLTGGLLMPLLRLVSLQEGELYRGGRTSRWQVHGLGPPSGDVRERSGAAWWPTARIAAGRRGAGGAGGA